MSNSIHFEQLFERFSRFLDRKFSVGTGLGTGDQPQNRCRTA
jgi:hypothetical protein